ncbi:ABC-1 domain protein [Denitrovibrio acetiphilus DSM 12809]|uniref:ABC-1 domain protein n=1 Tax=Denitrovibrio acetiphilus (strain DSM 12809 / NBRC 114555 / N2460) TaxID=522772 RepID=D4H8W3_DENA2|nr:AarF/UbiB family protein [Denitrovibrio acetiphilus]ADD68462.1 ABC-1 domain protein [Denitrovibrio acetiphilus DSM 12809]
MLKSLRKYYNPFRIYTVFRVILTVFLIIKGRRSFLFVKPLPPEKLIRKINNLGASFIKLAQVLATRADFFTDEYLVYLRQLHDEIPPMSEKDFTRVFEKAFADKVCFKEFDKEPIASASIGRVHRAVLVDGREVAVKLRRFDIQNVIRADIRILNYFNSLFRPLFSENTKNSLDAVIAEFTKMIKKEVDLSVELSNLKKFAETYKYAGVSFPDGYSECSCADALVMSFVDGYRFDDKENLKKLNINFEDIMKKLVYFYVDQMFIKGYFHADPHPGNLMVTEKGELILLDFGMVQKIPSKTRQAIIQLVKAAHERNFEMYIRYAKRLGIISQDAPDFDLQDLAERIFDILDNDQLDAKSMQTLAFELLDSMKSIPYKLPQEAIYIMRVSSIIEGLGTNYVANFNGIKDILPILKDKLPEALGFDVGFLETAKHEFIELPLTFKKVKKIIDEMADFSLEVKLSPDDIERLKLSLFKHIRPFMAGVILIVTAFFVQRSGLPYDRVISIVLYCLGVLRIIFTL